MQLIGHKAATTFLLQRRHNFTTMTRCALCKKEEERWFCLCSSGLCASPMSAPESVEPSALSHYCTLGGATWLSSYCTGLFPADLSPALVDRQTERDSPTTARAPDRKSGARRCNGRILVVARSWPISTILTHSSVDSEF